MRKMIFGSVLSVSLFLCMWAAAPAAPLKIATTAPEGSHWMVEMRKGAEKIAKRTSGRVKLKLYGGGVMGTDKNVLRKIRIGQLQGGLFTGGQMSEVYHDMRVYSLPFVFRNLEEVDYVRERMDKPLLEGLKKEGFEGLGMAGGGFAYIMGKEPLRTLEDFKGLKIWVPEGDLVAYEVMKVLGLSPVTLPLTDVLTGLQAGLVDVVATSPVGAIVLQWHTHLRYLMKSPIIYVFGVMAVDMKAMTRLQPEDADAVRNVIGGLYARFEEDNRRSDVEAMEALANQGIAFVDMAPETVAEFRKASAEAVRKLAREGVFSEEMLDRMDGYLEEYRRKGGTGQQ